MFGSANSIEPIGPVAVAPAKVARRAVDEPPVREATAADLAASARRAKASDATAKAAASEPVKAVPVAPSRAALFGRREAEPVQPDAVSERHNLYVAEKRGTRTYFADYQQKQEVMRADTKRISTKQDDRQTVAAVLDLAEERGWQKLRLRGTESFRREAWVQAQVRGIEAEGYKATATDAQEVARRLNVVAPTASAGAMPERPESKPTQASASKESAAVPVAAPVATAKQVPISVPSVPAAVPVSSPASKAAAAPKASRRATAEKSAPASAVLGAPAPRMTSDELAAERARTAAAPSVPPPVSTPAAKIPADVAAHDAKIAAMTPEQRQALGQAAYGSLEAGRKTMQETMARLDSMTPERRRTALLEMSAPAAAVNPVAAAQKAVWGSVEDAGRVARESAKSAVVEKAGERSTAAASA